MVPHASAGAFRVGYYPDRPHKLNCFVPCAVCMWLSVLAQPASAQVFDVWTHSGDGNWDNAAFWSNGVPNTNSFVRMNNGYTVSFSDKTLQANTIDLDDGSALLFDSAFAQTLDVNRLHFGGTANSFLRFDNNILTLTNRVLVDGSDGFLGDFSGDSLYNNGIIDADIRNGKLTIQSSNFYNHGSLRADGGILYVNSTSWFNTGKMSTSNGGTIYLGGTLYNGGSVFDAINSVGGTHHAILTGTISSGKIANSNALVSQNGTLAFVKLDGGLTLMNGYSTFIGDKVMFGKGSVTTIDNGSQLAFTQSQNQTLSNGTVVFGGTSTSYLTFNFRNLTLASSELVYGSKGNIGTGNLDQLINNGTIDADVTGGPLTISSAHFTNNGLLEATQGQLTVKSEAWTNNGTILVAGQHAAMVVSNALVSNGMIAIAARNSLELDGGLTQVNGSTLDDGLLKLAVKQPIFKLQGGVLTGFGTLSGDLLNSGGTLKSDDLVPYFTIDGNYTQTAGGKTEISVGGTKQGINYDLLKVLDHAALGGELDVKLSLGFKPKPGEVFNILLYGSRTGAYNDIVSLDSGYAYDMQFNDSTGVASLVVTTAPVPESSTVISLSLLLLTGGLCLRRQRRAECMGGGTESRASMRD